MGCDIHLYVEVIKDGAWVSADTWKIEDGDKVIPYGSRFYSGRNYWLFAMLADVRNNGEVNPFSPPRGLPPDMSVEVEEEARKWEGDAHSHSYFTMSELHSFDWNQRVLVSGVLGVEGIVTLLKTGVYERVNYFQGRKEIPPADMIQLIAEGRHTQKGAENLVSQVRFWASYRALTLDFWKAMSTIDKLGYSGDEARVVFWFDN